MSNFPITVHRSTAILLAALAATSGCQLCETSACRLKVDSPIEVAAPQPADERRPAVTLARLDDGDGTAAALVSFENDAPPAPEAITAAVVPAPAGGPNEPIAGMTIDLASALAHAGVANPTIALARERVSQALAEQQAANVLLLPSLNAGMNYHLHIGNLQRSPGTILNVDSSDLYFGAGARTLAAESVAFPGVRLFAPLADALLEPEAASYNAAARSAESRVVQNESLLRVAESYLQLVGADARLVELKHGEEQLGEIARLTDVYARTGQGREADKNRAATRLSLLTRERQDAEGERAAVSARLASLLNMDPSMSLAPIPGAIVPVMMVDDTSALTDLIYRALVNRPERAAGFAQVNEARTRYRQEVLRPWMPTLVAGLSGGVFGGGSNLVTYTFGRFDGRTDFDLLAVWSLQNFGFGNAAQQNRTSARADQATSQLIGVENQIRSEVGEALAEVQAQRSQLAAVEQAVISAREGAQEELTRIQSDVARPLEVIDSFEQLIDARVAYVQTVTAYNVAQFRLWVAVGGTPVATSMHAGESE